MVVYKIPNMSILHCLNSCHMTIFERQLWEITELLFQHYHAAFLVCFVFKCLQCCHVIVASCVNMRGWCECLNVQLRFSNSASNMMMMMMIRYLLLLYSCAFLFLKLFYFASFVFEWKHVLATLVSISIIVAVLQSSVDIIGEAKRWVEDRRIVKVQEDILKEVDVIS